MINQTEDRKNLRSLATILRSLESCGFKVLLKYSTRFNLYFIMDIERRKEGKNQHG